MKQQNGAITLCLCPTSQLWQCFEPARLNQVLIRPVHRGSTVSSIPSKLTCTQLINVCLGYHSLNLDSELSYLTIFSHYTYFKLLFQTTPVGDIFQQQIMKYPRICQMYLVLQMTFLLQDMMKMARTIIQC